MSDICEQHDRLRCSECAYTQELKDEAAKQKAIADLAIKALEEINKTYMKYIENELECDSAASKMDDVAEKVLEEIKRISTEGVSP